MKEDKNLKQNLDNSNEKLHISDVRCSYPITGDRVQLINTHGEDNLEYGIVIKHGEIRLDIGKRCIIPDWKYQLKLV